MQYKLLHGDSMEQLKKIKDNQIDAVVTDPPYGLSFMGKKWDYDVPQVDLWKEVFRVLKPGGHLLSFAGTRTYHRMAVNIEDAGFEIRDMISWLYGSGFPKSLNIGRQMAKINGEKLEGEFTTVKGIASYAQQPSPINERDKFRHKTKTQWEGWGSALKPACEPIVVARKPLSEKNIALNVLKHGTGGINIDGCRIEHNERIVECKRKDEKYIYEGGWDNTKNTLASASPQGRFPANIILDEEAGKILDEQTGLVGGDTRTSKSTYDKGIWGNAKPVESKALYNDKGGASRFFYCAKASKRERNEGLDILTTVKLIRHKDIETLWKEENMELAQLLLKDILDLEAMSLNIGESGESITVMCQKECLSTIKTTINKITELKTWNLLMQSLTKDFILDVNTKMENGSNHVKFVENLRKLMMKTGTSPERVGLVMEDVKSATLKLLLMLKRKENDWQTLKNIHSTVKPIKLMQYLVRLVTPKGAICLDPFMGSGTTGIACVKEGVKFVGIEREEEYLKIAKARIEATQ